MIFGTRFQGLLLWQSFFISQDGARDLFLACKIATCFVLIEYNEIMKRF